MGKVIIEETEANPVYLTEAFNDIMNKVNKLAEKLS